MNKLVAAALLVLVATLPASPAHAEGGPFGLGLVVGTPGGISGAYRLGNRTAIAGAVGLDLFDGRRFYVHGDFLFLLPNLLRGGSVGLSPYLGPGIFISDRGRRDDGSRLGVGARVPFGLSLDFRSAPIQIFGELAIIVPLVPEPNLGIGGAVGFRYYF